MADTVQQLLDKADAARKAAEMAADQAQHYASQIADMAGVAGHAATGGAIDPFVFRFAIFALAIFVGYFVVSKCPPPKREAKAVINACSSGDNADTSTCLQFAS